MNEKKIIAQLSQYSDFIGDDAAILPTTKNLLISKDILVEDVHFSLKYFTPEALAHKALHVNLSDIAAMGGTPTYLMLGLSIPKNFPEVFIQKFLAALQRLCKKNNVKIIGGDTTRSSNKFFISVTIFGSYQKHYKSRNKAKAGDILCVTGHLGDALAGLQILQKNTNGYKNLKQKQLCPNARIEEGKYLGSQIAVTSMMDLSDGLYLDLPKLCTASKVGSKVFIETIPISSELQKFSSNALNFAITGGEDYELLFTVNPKKFTAFEEQYKAHFKQPFYAIGEITSTKKINYLKNGKPIQLKLKPFEH